MGFADMGSSSSKPNVPASSSPSSSAGVPGKSRSKSSSKRRVYFQSSCLGSHDYDNDNEDKVIFSFFILFVQDLKMFIYLEYR